MADIDWDSAYNENDIRCIIPEAIDPVIQISSPSLKNSKSYWHVGTSEVSRVKLSALATNVKILHEDARTIIGTATEQFKRIETLGTALIELDSKHGLRYFEVYVTKSTDEVPLLVDGIFGLDLIRGKCNLYRPQGSLFPILRSHEDPNFAFKLLPASAYIPNYLPKLRDSIRQYLKANGKYVRLSASEKLNEMRPYLPPEVGADSRLSVMGLLVEFADSIYFPGGKIEPTKLIKYPIKLKRNDIITKEKQLLPKLYSDEIEVHVRDFLRQGIIRRSLSPWNFPVGLQEKKPDARGNIKYRFVVLFGSLNGISEEETFAIPDIYDAVDELYGSKYFSVLDLAMASSYIPLEPKDCEKTAFTTQSGHYEFTRMPDAIKNAQVYTQYLMSKAFGNMRGQIFLSHDDILVHAPTIEEHEIRLRKVFTQARANGLKFQPGKFQLIKNKVLYLGFLITDEGWFPNPKKIKILRQPRPNNSDDLRSFLGLLSTYKSFIPDYASKAKPMWDLLKKDTFQWTVEAAANFKDFQAILSKDLVLRYPNWNTAFIIETGSSKYGIYAGLMQKKSRNAKPHVISWSSRTYSPAESLLDFEDKESVASKYGLDIFYRYKRTDLNNLTQRLSIKK